MHPGWWLAIGILIAAPLAAAATLYFARRIWRNTRRLTARARGHEHLIEVGQLVGGLAHEIKNPLSTINMNLKLLSEDLSVFQDEEHRRLQRRLGSVQSEADRLRGILDDFLRFAGKIEICPEPTDLRRIVQELVDFFAPQADAARVILRADLPDAEVVCRVDAKLIKQALLNLMINAVQAMEHGGEMICRLTTARGRAVLEVIDTGPGMPPEVQAKAFTVYYTTKPGGTGLGLPTTRRIIREHQGAIQLDSQPGAGTRFIIKLPMQGGG